MQESLASPAYPKALPDPTIRKGGLTYEIRVRVPPNAQGGRFNGSHTSRSLRTRDKAEALKRLPSVYADLQGEFDAEATRLSEQATKTVVAEPPAAAEPTVAVLTVDDACRLYRDHILTGERDGRKERSEGLKRAATHAASQTWGPTAPIDTVALAAEFKRSLQRRLETAKAEVVTQEYTHAFWFLRLLEMRARREAGLSDYPSKKVKDPDGVERPYSTLTNDKISIVADPLAAARAMARTQVQTLRGLIDDDETLGLIPLTVVTLGQTPPNTSPSVPLLSQFLADHISKRGNGLSEERADLYRAVVRDLIAVTSDKPVTTYGHEDAEAFENILRTLPANWQKRTALRGLTIVKAAAKAAKLGMAPQAPTNIQKKWTTLFGIFKAAGVRYTLKNPFIADALVLPNHGPSNAQWSPFTADELRALFTTKLEGNLLWLTWLGLFTGARLNELAQLTKAHVHKHQEAHYLYFSPDLRLKTGEAESCVRAVPLHSELIGRGFLEYVDGCSDLLFPGIPTHKTGRYSDAPSKAFSRHLKLNALKRPKLSFHSLRHTFAATFSRCAPRDSETRERLLGHTIPGVAGRYGNSYEAEAHDMQLLIERSKAIEMLRFDIPSKVNGSRAAPCAVTIGRSAP